MPNFKNPYGIEVDYSVDGRQHVFEMLTDVEGSVVAGADASTIDLKTRGGGTVNMVTAVTAHVTAIAGLFHTSAFIGQATLWKYDGDTEQRQFITAFPLGLNGTSSNPTVEAQQLTLTFRTQEGGILKQVFLDVTTSGSARIPLSNALNPAIIAIKNNVLAGTNFILAKDTSYPISPLNASNGQNERVWKSIYRN